MLISIDTNILIWGVRAVSSDGQEEMIPRAKEFLSWIDRFGHHLAITTEALAEFLVGPDEQARLDQFEVLTSEYAILNFDAHASLIASRIRSNAEFIAQMKQSGKTKPAIKSDINIVATAKAGGVEILYSHDDDHRKAGERCGLVVRKMPTVEEMMPLGQSPKPKDPSQGEGRVIQLTMQDFFDVEDE